MVGQYDFAGLIATAVDIESSELTLLALGQLMEAKKPKDYSEAEWEVIKRLSRRTQKQTPAVRLAQTIKEPSKTKPYITDWK